MGGGGLSIESRNTRVFKRGRRAALLIAALTPAVLLSGVSWQLVAGVIVALEMLRRLEAARWARSRSALVRTSNDDLVIERNGSHFRMKKSAITDCWQVPDTESGGTRVMVVSRRAQVSMLVSDRASADALGHALGMNPSAHVVGATLVSAPRLPKRTLLKALRQDGAYIAFTSIMASAPTFVLILLSRLNLPLPPLPYAVGLATLWVVWWNVQPSAPWRVYVGRDGLLVTTLERREFVGFERVKHAAKDPWGIRVQLVNGDEILLPVWARKVRFGRKPHPLDEWVTDPAQIRARRATLVRQINAALEQFRKARADASTATLARLLDRGARPLDEWREALSRERAETYRDRKLDLDQLVSVLENPQLPLGQRLGAALALADRPEASEPSGGHQPRVRAAIASSANPRVRIALERAAEGRLDDADYERALEAEAEAARAASKRASVKPA